ncbi:MAG: SpoIIE family protein phosphatase [bacterium]|nr:SpoIIE family protein phosphatase [bacterium]
MTHRVVVTLPDGARRTVPLVGDSISLGRSGNNDLSCPEDNGLSRHHMAFERDGDDWRVRDLGSKNGTLVNDVRIEEAVSLKAGDRVVASRVTLVYDGTLEEQPVPEGTVIFDASQPISSRPPTHTVTLGDLLPGQEPNTGDQLGAAAQWSDPVKALLRAGRELVAKKPVKNLFSDILDLSLEAVGATRGVLLAFENDELAVQASRGEEFHISTAVRDRVVNERSSLLISDAMSDEALKKRESIVMQGVHSLMAAPLQTDEQVLGLIYVDSPHLWREFKAEDLNLLTVMANVAAMRIERERLAATEQARKIYQRDLEQASEIQKQFLPRETPQSEGVELAGYNEPCHTVGGDYYDFVQYPDGRLVIALGDVAGKGMPAALLMVNLQARVQMLAEQPSPPSEMVAHLNKAMTAACPGNRFVTFFLCQIDPATGELVFSNAGHNPPYLVRASGDVEELDGGGPVLGILPGIKYTEHSRQVDPGDTLVIYSDGVSEAADPDENEFGEERLIELIREHRQQSPQELIDTIITKVEEFASGAPAADDFTLVVVRRTG